MFKPASLSAIVLAIAGIGNARASEPDLAPQGSYEVEVRLELPYVEDATASKLETTCLFAADGSGHRGFRILSENNPFTGCPTRSLRRNREMLTFDIVCEGADAARTSASFILGSQGFQGRIVMKLGGKNMTVTEIQRGRRLGDCHASALP
jgi:hypothetical protein